MLSNHLILCCPLLFLPSVFPSIRVFFNKLALHIRWPKYWTFSISPSNEYLGLISFKIDWFVESCCPSESQESSPAPQFKSISSSGNRVFGLGLALQLMSKNQTPLFWQKVDLKPQLSREQSFFTQTACPVLIPAVTWPLGSLLLCSVPCCLELKRKSYDQMALKFYFTFVSKRAFKWQACFL